jgi:hypothetical protein
MAMFLFLDSNYRNALAFGGRQLGSVFSEAVQRTAHSCSDRASTISQISYRLGLQPPGQRVAIVLGGLENFSTGTRSSVELAPLNELEAELTGYVRMVMDILKIYPLVSVFVLPPLFCSFPAWCLSAYETMLPRFVSDVSHIDPDRVKVVPPLATSAQDLDFDGVHLNPAALQRVLDLLLISFRDGVFVNPDDYPVSEDLRKLNTFIFMCPSYQFIFLDSEHCFLVLLLT